MKYKQMVEIILACLCWPVVRLWRGRRTRVILYYHGVNELEAKQFARQMAYLNKCCQVVPLQRVWDVCSAQRHTVVLTFDDAFENLVDHALPVLEQHRLPATIFVPTGNLGELPQWRLVDDSPDRSERVMTWKKLGELDKAGIDIGSHTVTHPRLDCIDMAAARLELTDSKSDLEAHLGHPIESISYPHGAYNSEVLQAVKDAGYTCAVTIEPRVLDTREATLQMPRFCMSPTDGLLKLSLVVSGAYQVVYYLRKLKSLCLTG